MPGLWGEELNKGGKDGRKRSSESERARKSKGQTTSTPASISSSMKHFSFVACKSNPNPCDTLHCASTRAAIKQSEHSFRTIILGPSLFCRVDQSRNGTKLE
eukprot:2666268-Rhodomonas_salina.1